jgi:hypothetical protein
VKATGGVRRAKGKLTTRGRTASAELALRFDPSLDGAKLEAEVEATDFRGRRQIGCLGVGTAGASLDLSGEARRSQPPLKGRTSGLVPA